MNLHVSIMHRIQGLWPARRPRSFLSLWITFWECVENYCSCYHRFSPHLVSHRNYWIFMTRQIFFQTFLNSSNCSPCNFVFKMNCDDEVKNRLIRVARGRVYSSACCWIGVEIVSPYFTLKLKKYYRKLENSHSWRFIYFMRFLACSKFFL